MATHANDVEPESKPDEEVPTSKSLDAHGGQIESLSASPVGPERPEDQGTRLIRLSECAKLFHTSDRKAYASVPVGTNCETLAVDSEEFALWLTGEFYRKYRLGPAQEAIRKAVRTIKAKAIFEGPQESVHVRVAGLRGTVYLDLCNDSFEAVEVSADGWGVIRNPPVWFRRPKGMEPLPRPEHGGNIEELKSVLNVGARGFQLIVGYLLGALQPNGPYPVLVLTGRQGSAKSTTARYLRSLVDPNQAVERGSPRNERDLMVYCENSWIVTFDNLSGLKTWLSDALCRVSTGGALSARKLYTDSAEHVFMVSNPVLLNGIGHIATRGDLLDRAIVIELPKIPPHKRLLRAELDAWVEKIRPRILGVLLDAVAMGLRNAHTVNLGDAPRLADFARFVAAAVPAFGWRPEEFLDAYSNNRSDAAEIALGAHPVAAAVLTLLEKATLWEGTATELLGQLAELTELEGPHREGWPKDATRLSTELNRLEPALEEAGITIEHSRASDNKRERRIRLIRTLSDAARPDLDSPASDAESLQQRAIHSRTLPDAGTSNLEEKEGSEEGNGEAERTDSPLSLASDIENRELAEEDDDTNLLPDAPGRES